MTCLDEKSFIRTRIQSRKLLAILIRYLDEAVEAVCGPVGDLDVGLVGNHLDGDAGQEAQGPVAHGDRVEQVGVRI